MIEIKRLIKNRHIKERILATKLKRTRQTCRVFRVKIDISHLNNYQREVLQMLFVESKWMYNDIITFTPTHQIDEYSYKTKIVHVLDKDKQPVTREIKYLPTRLRQSVIASIKDSMKSLAAQKRNGYKTGSIKYK